MSNNISICPWCKSGNPNKIGVKLTLKNDFRITCQKCGKKYAKTEKGIARIYGNYNFFSPLKYTIIFSFVVMILGKFIGVSHIHLIAATLLIVSILCVTMAFEGLLTGELPSQGPPVYRDLNPDFFKTGILLYFSIAILGVVIALIMFLK